MKNLAAVLKQKLENAGKVAVLGIGSELRSDDAAGVLAAQQIKKISSKKKLLHLIKVFIGSTAPENLTGEIKKFKPSHLIIIDSADMNAPPGQVTIINSEKVGGTSFCTHSLPLKVMIDYLRQSCDCETIIIGIQPKNLSVGGPISKEVDRAAQELAVIVVNLLEKTDDGWIRQKHSANRKSLCHSLLKSL
ncbi:MAG: hydrogenase maturation peptidase HycI [Sedimentisphaerales bacterium]